MHTPSRKKEDFIYGIRTLIEAVNAGKEIDKVLLSKKPDSEIMQEVFPLIRKNGIPFQYVPVEKLNKITRKNHQGVIAFLSEISYAPLEEMITSVYEKGVDPRFLILDRVSDVRNFGAIARSVECLGFSGIIIPEKGSARINADAVKTSAGAIMNVPVSRVRSLVETVKYLQSSGIKVAAVTEKTERNLFDQELTGPLALIMGNEEQGISEKLIKIADALISIPMKGKTLSLNVSVAASVTMYEALRQTLNH